MNLFKHIALSGFALVACAATAPTSPVVTASDVACVSAVLPKSDQDTIRASLVHDIELPPGAPRDDSYRDRAISLLLPRVLDCASRNGWEQKRTQGVFFHIFNGLIGPYFRQKAQTVGIDVGALQVWFDKQPERLRLNWFSPEMPQIETDTAITRMSTELAIQGYDVQKLLADTGLSTFVLKSMVSDARLKAGLGMFERTE